MNVSVVLPSFNRARLLPITIPTFAILSSLYV